MFISNCVEFFLISMKNIILQNFPKISESFSKIYLKNTKKNIGNERTIYALENLKIW